jgi:hypothetical protein
MNIKVHPVQVDLRDPFSVDRLNRREEVENLTVLIRNINSPTVIAVNSGWGTGKTTFVKMWSAQLGLDGVSSLYFNAWDSDYAPDPLVAFLGEMNTGLKKLIGGSKKSRQAWSAAKKVGGQIVKRGLPALIRVGTVGIIDAERIVEDELSGLLEGLAGDALKVYEEQKTAIKDFKKSLTTVVRESPENAPVVIFVDELDRCRPDYALHLLERIKHLFDIVGIVFVLALDKEQLTSSVRAIYGSGLDADGYLRRFIDIEYILKVPDVSQYLASLYESLKLERFFRARSQYRGLQNDWREFSSVFQFLSGIYGFSLREIEQLLGRFSLVLWSTPDNRYVYPALLCFLLVVRERARPVYERYLSEGGDAREIIEHLYSLVPEEVRLRSRECSLVEGSLIAGNSKWGEYKWGEYSLPEMRPHQSVLENEEASNEAKHYAQRVVAVVKRPAESMMDGVDLPYLAKKIELLDQFRSPGDVEPQAK